MRHLLVFKKPYHMPSLLADLPACCSCQQQCCWATAQQRLASVQAVAAAHRPATHQGGAGRGWGQAIALQLCGALAPVLHERPWCLTRYHHDHACSVIANGRDEKLLLPSTA